ncbi:ABC transporter G family member 15-like [Humulus lupulus]|uniref:ABC transporter G family member 15-like n=1 Tax=Humulus lupulus TaxID=3486 RepID=UPI002B401315|nr:ABC transporter G family member 15-like [Humulus lupulus]
MGDGIRMEKYEDDEYDDVVISMEGKEMKKNNVKKVIADDDDDDEGPYLVWEDITVVLKSNTKGRKVLNQLCGYAKPNRIMALMGPSGSGKSTLLDAFSGRLSSNVGMIGSVHVKGKKENSRNFGGISYLTQEDVFLGTLTVRETITYSAHLRVSNKMSKEEIEKLVEKTIEEMGLQHCAEGKIGNWHFRGISGGEKKRLSIGLEILTQPQIMLLDEPTTGLDSASAFFVVCTLNNIAHHGRIVVCSIHQPSGYLFDLFDDLYLLSGGDAVYFGDAKLAAKFFADAGFPCPTRANPTDHFLRCVNSDFDNISTQQSRFTMSGSLAKMTTQEIKEILIHKYNNSEYATLTRDRIQQINSTEEVIVLTNKSKASWWKQLYTLTDRSFVNMRRDVGYYWLRMVFYLGVSVCTGIINYKINTSYLDIIARAKCQAFVYGFMIYLSNGGLPSFIEEIKVYNSERLKNHYGAAVVMVSNFVASFPFLLVTAISTGTIIYEMVKLHPGFSHYSYFVLNLFCCLSVIETLMMLVAFMVPNVLMGIGIGTALIVFMMMASEIFRPISDLPKFFWRYPMSYISFASWALQGVYKNDMIGIEFDPLVAGDPKLKGEILLQTMFGMPLDHSKWWDLMALVCLLILHRLIFLLVLKYKDTISLHSKIYANTVFHQIAKTRSLTQHFTVSNRNQTLYSLSSQLDLTSPMRPS